MDFIISHRRDLDGLSSAAILKRSMPDAKVFLVDYEDMPRVFKEIMNDKEARVYVADLNLGITEKEALSYIKKIAKSGRVRWFDHHRWDEDIVRLISDYIDLNVNHDKCATEVVFDFFGEGDSVCAKIARYARDQDFYIKQIHEANKISDLIAAKHLEMDFLLDLVDLLSQGVFWKDEFDQIRDDYLVQKEILLKDSLKNTTYYDNFAISFSNPLVPSGQVAKETVEKEHKDILVLLYPSGRMSFRRSGGSNVDLSKLARSFGGGGHPFASGANFGSQVSEKNVDGAKRKISDKVQEWLLKRS